jgi:arsenate reductase
MILFLCYPRCSTCQKARAWLDQKGIDYKFRDIKKDNPSAEEIRKWRDESGLPLKKFFNTSGNSYKNLGLRDKLSEMSEPDQIALLAADGLLVKRPILVGRDFALVGFKPEEWSERLK